MYCIIQKISKVKPDTGGYAKALKVDSYLPGNGNENQRVYTYHYSKERFERRIRNAYCIRVQQSYRRNGQVKKQQFVICTVDYYSIAENWFNIYEDAESKVIAVADKLGVDAEELFQLIDSKLDLLYEQIQAEFRQTEEYLVNQEHRRIIE